MPLPLKPPVLYLITNGETTPATTPASKTFTQILELIEAAVKADISLIQLREKNLNARVLYELTVQAARLVKDTNTQLLVNDRSDIARSGGADGVHLASSSIDAGTIRRIFGPDFLIGVSTHSEAEAQAARDANADFAVYGPIFRTASKQMYGDPVGTARLRQTVSSVRPFPLLALGGISLENVEECFRAGAAGIAAISLFADPARLGDVVTRIREMFAGPGKDEKR